MRPVKHLVMAHHVHIVAALIIALLLGVGGDDIDKAKLEISIKDYVDSSTISVLALNSDCWKCSYVEIGNLVAKPGKFRNVTLYANHTTTIKLTLLHEENSSSQFLCQQEISVRENAYYKMFVSTVGDRQDNASCKFIIADEGVDSYLPILYAFVILTGLALLWVLTIKLYKYRRCRFADSTQSESLVHSDLGSTNTVLTESQPQVRRSARLKSLDSFRGLSLMIMIFVNYGGGKYWFFAHSSWNGVTVADLVFPWFVFIMGTALAFVFNSHHRKGKSKLRLCVQIVVRVIKLFVLGLMINSTRSNDLTKLRIPGVLQRFSLTYLVVALTELVFSGGYTRQHITAAARWYHSLRDIIYFWPSWLVAFTALIAQIIVTFAVPYDMNDCPTGYIGPGGISEDSKYFNCTGGIAKYIDLQVLGQGHIYQHGTCKHLYQCPGADPEGLLGTLTSVFLCFLGVQAGRILVTYSDAKARVIRWLIWAVGLGCIALLLSKGTQNDGWIPINKNLWSASFVIAMGAMAFLLLSVLYIIIDVKEFWSGAPFIYPGMNSIFVYVGSETLEHLIPVSFAVSHTHIAQLFMNLWGVSFWVLVSAYMYYKNICITV